MEQRAVGVVAIIVKKRAAGAPEVNEVLTQFGDIILGRMGLPYAARDLNIITLIVDATTDQIGALTGKLGMIPDVTVKSTLAKDLKENEHMQANDAPAENGAWKDTVIRQDEIDTLPPSTERTS